jgi:hypothetical protein
VVVAVRATAVALVKLEATAEQELVGFIREAVERLDRVVTVLKMAVLVAAAAEQSLRELPVERQLVEQETEQ